MDFCPKCGSLLRVHMVYGNQYQMICLNPSCKAYAGADLTIDTVKIIVDTVEIIDDTTSNTVDSAIMPSDPTTDTTTTSTPTTTTSSTDTGVI